MGDCIGEYLPTLSMSAAGRLVVVRTRWRALMVIVPLPVVSTILKECIYRAGICASPIVFRQP